ncbi:MAG: FAD-dependent monooxygenase [Pseudomonadota bacterium]
MNNPETYDIAIVGGGFAGTALALALHSLSKCQLSLVLIDKKRDAQNADLRASAIAAGARRLLQKIEAWPNENLAQPVQSMRITDSALKDGVRPTLLNFISTADGDGTFAHMIENRYLMATLTNALQNSGITQMNAAVAKTEINGQSRVLHLENGETVSARLAAACDGAHSKLREAANIKMIGRDYDQAALVTTITHEEPHHGEAIEHFLEAGPFASLPLTDDTQGRHRSSLVWTERKPDAARLLQSSSDELNAEIAARLGYHWDKIEIIDKVQSFPLSIRLAKQFTAERLALVGDAAHVIHPIAGQGLNLGFRDAAALAEVIVDALRLGQDFGTADILARYQQWRRFDTLMMGAATDGLNALFSKQSILLRGLRSLGLSIVDRTAPLKDFFMQSAAGDLGDVPRLMR